MSPRIIGLLLTFPLAGAWLASCRAEGAGEAEPEADTMVDTAYAIAAYRTEAQARLDHLAIRIARLRVRAEAGDGLGGELAGLDRRREQLGRQIEAFDPSATDWERQAATLDSALADLDRDVDRLSNEVPEAPSPSDRDGDPGAGEGIEDGSVPAGHITTWNSGGS
jgi:hypothetical protein